MSHNKNPFEEMEREAAKQAVWDRHMGKDNLRDRGSDHYRNLSLQPWDAMEHWGHPIEFYGFLKYCAVKRLARLNEKGEILKDIEKSIHELEKLREWYLENQAAIDAVIGHGAGAGQSS